MFDLVWKNKFRTSKLTSKVGGLEKNPYRGFSIPNLQVRKFSMEQRIINAIDYDINSLVADCIRHGIDIATQETEKDWKMLAHAFRALDIDETSFVAVSRIHGDATERESRAAYRYAKRQYFTREQAAQKILYFASRAGIKIWDYLPLAKQEAAKAEWKRQENTAAIRRTDRALQILRGQMTTPPATPQAEATKEAPKEYLSPGLIEQSERIAGQTALYKFMLSEFGEAARSIFAAYHVGGCKWYEQPHGLTTAFPLIDALGNLHDFQLAGFTPEGKSATFPSGGKVRNWALSRMGKSESRPGFCFFGEHLLHQRPTAEVAIVEAPKTALIAALCYPQFVWVACLSKMWLNSAVNCEPIKNRKIWLFPDRDGVEVWEAKARELAAAGYDVGVSDVMEQYPGESGDDLADIILRHRHGTQQPPEAPKADTPTKSPDKLEAEALFEEMKKSYPALAELAEKFDLEPISVEPYRCQNENE